VHDSTREARDARAGEHFQQARQLVQRGDDVGAVAQYERAIALSPDVAVAHTALSAALLRLGRHREAGTAAARAIRLNPSDALALVNLGLADLNRGDARAAIEHLTKATSLAPRDPRAHFNLALALREDQRLESAEHAARDALDRDAGRLQPESRARAHEIIAAAAEARYERNNARHELELAAREYAAAIDNPIGPDGIAQLTGLRAMAEARVARDFGHAEPLRRAIELLRDVNGRYADDPTISVWTRAGLGAQLATVLRDRYLRGRDEGDLQQSIAGYNAALAAMPDAQVPVAWHHNLGAALNDRFKLKQNRDDLDAAIEHATVALKNTPSGDRARQLHEVGLAGVLLTRYGVEGRLEDLNAAISYDTLAVEDVSQALRPAVSDLAGALKVRFERLGDVNDLARSVELLEQAAEQPPLEAYPRAWATTQSNLAEALALLAAQTEDVGRAERAVDHAARSIDATPVTDLAYANRLSQKALSLMTVHRLGGSPTALDEAIAILKDASRFADAQSEFRAVAASRLAKALRERWVRDRSPADYELALREAEAALGALGGNSPHRPRFLQDVAILAREHFERTGVREDLLAAIEALEQAWEIVINEFPDLPVTYKLGAARANRPISHELVAAHLNIARAERDEAASRSHRRRAWEIAEGAKSRVLSDYITRAELPSPPGVASALIERERDLLDELQRLDALEFTDARAELGDDAYATSASDRAARMAVLAQVWREIEGEGPAGKAYVELRFPRQPTWSSVQSLLRSTPLRSALLSLWCTAEQTVLLTITEDTDAPHVLVLPWGEQHWDDLLEQLAQELARSRGDSRLPETWHRSLIEGIAPSLSRLEQAEQVAVIPAGRAITLPWPVVFDRASQQMRSCPEVTVSPNVGILQALAAAPSHGTVRTLVVGNPTDDLPHSEEEAKAVAELLDATPLFLAKATRAAVLAALPTAEVTHLAAHGYFTPAQPLESGILLHDAVLTGRDVLARRLCARLVVLSACESGLLQRLGGEEFAGLAQAFLSAGVGTLVVSLWPVEDDATAILMTHFHRHVAEHGRAARALREAADETRSSGYSSPYLWGAFICVGGIQGASTQS
jgi:CHAT domain-containing protein/tetratricopeptide (TPR) repeat protein